ncbi:MAG: FkbM family methyltransferase, partial [Bacteroidia bacterium]|nr:FkbM family methyltransferase [Bacteroidia bacterium]
FELKKDIRMIKIDVEGFELEVLKGADEILMQNDSPILIVECSETRENTFGADVGLIYDQLKNNHYRLYKSKGGKERVSKLVEIISKSDLPKHDNIYCFKNIHLHSVSSHLFEDVPVKFK